MNSFFFKKNHRICIIIKDHVLRFVEVSHPNMIKMFGERRLPLGVIREGNIVDKDTLLNILEECLEKWKMKNAKLLFCVPDSYYVIRKTTVPSHIPDERIKGELYFELGEKLHLPFANPLLEISKVGEVNGEKEVIVVASPEEVINDYRYLFEEAKLKPSVIGVSSLSIYRLFYSLDLANQQDHFLIVQVNLDSINMTIFYQDIPVFTRHIRTFVDGQAWETTMDKLDQLIWTFNGENRQIEEQIHDFILELGRIINFYHFSVHKGENQVTKIVLTGDHPFLDKYIKKSRESISIPIMNIPESIFKTESDCVIPARFYDAIGLSMHNISTSKR